MVCLIFLFIVISIISLIVMVCLIFLFIIVGIIFLGKVRRHSWNGWKISGWSSCQWGISHINQKCSLIDNLGAPRGGSKDRSPRGCRIVIGHVVFIVDDHPSGGDILAYGCSTGHG